MTPRTHEPECTFCTNATEWSDIIASPCICVQIRSAFGRGEQVGQSSERERVAELFDECISHLYQKSDDSAESYKKALFWMYTLRDLVVRGTDLTPPEKTRKRGVRA